MTLWALALVLVVLKGSLTCLTALWANSADDNLMIFFLFFPQRIDFEISCKSSPQEKTVLGILCKLSPKEKKGFGILCKLSPKEKKGFGILCKFGDNLHKVSKPFF